MLPVRGNRAIEVIFLLWLTPNINTELEVEWKGTRVRVLIWIDWLTPHHPKSVQAAKGESFICADEWSPILLIWRNVALVSTVRPSVEEIQWKRYSVSVALLRILVFHPLCLLSRVLAKWMLCLQHVLVLSSGVCARVFSCAQVRLSGSVLLPWQQLLGKRVCACMFSMPV